MNCGHCGDKIVLNPSPSSGFSYPPYRYMGGTIACFKCVAKTIGEMQSKPREIVGNCPHCGSPVYGVKELPYVADRVCSGDVFYGTFQAAPSCRCSWNQKRIGEDELKNLDSKFDKLRNDFDKILKIEIRPVDEKPKKSWWKKLLFSK